MPASGKTTTCTVELFSGRIPVGARHLREGALCVVSLQCFAACVCVCVCVREREREREKKRRGVERERDEREREE